MKKTNNTLKTVVLLAMVALGASAGVAHAGLTIAEEASRKAAADAQESRGSGRYQAQMAQAAQAGVSALPSRGVIQLGTPDSILGATKGFARDVSLLTALKQIVPSGWKARRLGGLDVNMPVSWKGHSKSWLDVLETLAEDGGFSALVDWRLHEVTVAPAGYFSQHGSVLVSREQQERKIEVAKAPGPRTWTLTPDKTLKENLESWAKEAGWTVSWGSVDYPIAAEVTLQGEFDDEAGPLRQVVEAYRTADQPLTVKFFRNRVVRVENAGFKPLPQQDTMPNHRVMD